MTNQQLYVAIGVPILFNAALLGLVVGYFNTRFADLRSHFNTRLDDLRDLWRSELYRVEGVLDARLKHLEEHR